MREDDVPDAPSPGRTAPSFISICAHKNTITAPLSVSTPHLRLPLFQMQSSNYQPIEQISWLHTGHFFCKCQWNVAWSEKRAPGKMGLIMALCFSWRRYSSSDIVPNIRMTLPWGVKCWWVQNGAEMPLAPCPNPATQGCRKDMDISSRSGEGTRRVKHHRGERSLCSRWTRTSNKLNKQNKLWACFYFVAASRGPNNQLYTPGFYKETFM